MTSVFSVVHPCAELVLGGLVAAVEHVRRQTVHLSTVVVVEGLGGLGLVDTHAVEDEGHAHHEVVAAALDEEHALVLYPLDGTLQAVAEGHADGIAMIVDGMARRLHPDEVAVGVDA